MTRKRARTLLRWPAVLAALGCVLAPGSSAAAGAEPDDDAAQYEQCRTMARELAAETTASGAITCLRPDGTPLGPERWLPAAPAPVPVSTGDHAGCVTGPERPLVDTTLTTARATTGSARPIAYQYQQLDGVDTIGVSGGEILEFTPGALAPGGSYRWRARADERGWSPWCEFTVAPDAADYSGLGHVSLESLHDLEVRPDRTYPVRLSSRQQRLLRAGTDVGRVGARITLTGPRWADLLAQLTDTAFIAEQVAAEYGPDDPAPPDGTAYRTLVDVISARLGRPDN